MTDIIQLFCLLWRNQIFFSFLFVISFGNNWQVEVLSSNALYNINCYAFQCVTVGGATKKKIKTSKKDENNDSPVCCFLFSCNFSSLLASK